MPSAIKQNLNYIRDREATLRRDLGVLINIQNISGEIDCPNCVYDTHYRQSSNPNCATCDGKGKIKTLSDNYEYVLVKWITEVEMKELSAGDVAIGDCRLTAGILSKSLFENSLKDKIGIEIDSENVVPYRILPNVINTSINVFCRLYKNFVNV